MAIRFTRSCDFTGSSTPEDHEADHVAEVHLDGVVFSMDVCEPDRERLIGCLLELGFVPTRAQVGKNRRGAYVAHSGKTFTTKDARLWLIETGHDVAGSGRLTADQLQTYAAAH